MGPVSITPRPGGVLDVTLRGDIDYTNAAGVAEVIRDAVRQERPKVIRVNMAGVDFLDSSGIAVLVKAMKSARETGADYLVEGPNARVFDQLRMTGLTDLFPVEAAQPSALPGDCCAGRHGEAGA
jgi:anti-sigma B factor antagonist